MEKRHASQVAELHRDGIRSGFLSSLGRRFLTSLYKAVPSCPSGFGYVWEDDDGSVLGFVACAESTGGLYRQALLRRGASMMGSVLLHVFSWQFVKKAWETLRYPAKTADGLPPAEVLSIAVREDARGKGIAKALMDRALRELRARQIDQVKVAVGAMLRPVNRLYRACGFGLAVEREHHGLPMNIYVSQLLPQAAPVPAVLPPAPAQATPQVSAA
jgi:ribosomal protein S18 acetylase RimI-like enzyme